MSQLNKMKMIVKTIDSVIDDDEEGIISKYIEPISSCVCCNTHGLSIKINEAYLAGHSNKEIISMFSDECRRKTGKVLDSKILNDHFTNHLNSSGAAIAEYNRKKGLSNLQPEEKKQLSSIFDAIVHDKVNDLEILDLAMKEQIKRLKELQDIKDTRINEGRTNDLESLIMKQEIILNNLQTNVLNKLKVWQKAKFQSKQIEVMDKQSQFLSQKTLNFLGIEAGDAMTDPKYFKMAETMYLKVVLENIVRRLDSSLDTIIKLDQYKKTEIYRELNRQCKGIEKDINEQFKETLKNLKEVSPQTDEDDIDGDDIDE